MIGKHRGGRRPWRRRAPGMAVAVLAACSAGGVAEAALQGSSQQAGVVGAGGGVLTLAATLISWARQHRAEHRAAHAPSVPATTVLEPLTPAAVAPRPSAIQVAMSTPPLPRALTSATAATVAGAATVAVAIAGAGPGSAPALFAVPDLEPPSRNWMTDTVPHPVVKLFPMAQFEPEVAAGTMDERVYAALDAQREAAVTAQLARGRHCDPRAGIRPGAGAARPTSYRSRHSA